MNSTDTTTTADALAVTRAQFIEVAGNTTQSFGFGRIMGQIYALLYMSARPLCLDDIARDLSVSKASVSTTVRQLESWAAVKRVWVKGDRKDYYEAESNFSTLLRHGVLARVRRKIESAGSQLDHAGSTLKEALEQADESESNKEIKIILERLQRAKQFHSKINAVLNTPLLNHLL